MSKKIKTKRAFVLLYALLVAGIVLSIGMSLANIISKQIILSSLGRSSRIAYYAADAGRSCGQFWGPGYGLLIGDGSDFGGLFYGSASGQRIFCKENNTIINTSRNTNIADIEQILSLYGISGVSGYQRDDFDLDIDVTFNDEAVLACSKVTVLSFDGEATPAPTYKSIILSRGFSESCSKVNTTSANNRTVSRTVLGVVK